MSHITRRSALLGSVAAFIKAPAWANLATAPAPAVATPVPLRHVRIMWSTGQSWRSNYYPSFAGFGFPATVPLSLYSSDAWVGIAGPLMTYAYLPQGTASLSQNLVNLGPQWNPILPANDVTIGRCAALTQARLRAQYGLSGPDILEISVAWPGSTWLWGSAGGLGPGAIVTGSISGTTLTVDSVVSGVIALNQSMYVNSGNTSIGVITAFGTGTGGTGNYTIDTSQTLGESTIQCIGNSWKEQSQLIPWLAALPPSAKYVFPPSYGGIGYTQGAAGADATSIPDKISDLTAMLTLYDAMDLPCDLPGGKMHYYFGQPSAASNYTSFVDGNIQSYTGTTNFCVSNAPGQGGTWSGRCWFTSCSYAWPFDGADNIHTGDYGTCRWGEWEGYVRFLVEDLGFTNWTPLWQSLTLPVTKSGTTVTVPFDRPTSSDFAGGVLSWQSDPNDGIKVWPQYGWHYFRSGTEIPLVANPVINGMSVTCDIGQAPQTGDVITYAMYGPGGPSPGPCSGVGGNLVMNGPPSILFPNGYEGTPKTLDAWALPLTATVP